MADAGPAVESGVIHPGSQGERTRIVSIISHVSELALEIGNGTGGAVDTGGRPDALFDFTASPVEIGRLIDTRDLTNLFTWVEYTTASKPATNPTVQFLGVDRILKADKTFDKQNLALLVNGSDADAITYDITAGTVITVSSTRSAIAMLAAYRIDVSAFELVLPFRTAIVAAQGATLRCKGT